MYAKDIIMETKIDNIEGIITKNNKLAFSFLTIT